MYLFKMNIQILRKLTFLFLACLVNLTYSALSPSAMERVDADLMNKMYGVFEETNTQELFVVEDFEMKDFNCYFFTLTTANAKIRSLKDGNVRDLGYSILVTNKPGPQSGIAKLEKGRTYFMRIDCNDSICTPPFHKFFNYSADEYINHLNKHLINR